MLKHEPNFAKSYQAGVSPTAGMNIRPLTGPDPSGRSEKREKK